MTIANSSAPKRHTMSLLRSRCVRFRRKLGIADANVRERDVEPRITTERVLGAVFGNAQQLAAELLGPEVIKVEDTPRSLE